MGCCGVVAIASLMAIFLQVISAAVGCSDRPGCIWPNAAAIGIPHGRARPNWIFLASWRLAHAIWPKCSGSSAVAINLLFHIPVFWAVIITAADVLLLLAMQRLGMRKIEAIILVLVTTIAGCYFIEIFVLPQTRPGFLEMGLHALLHTRD